MGNIYQKIKKASPLKDGHEWKPTDENVVNSAGELLSNAEKRTTGGQEAKPKKTLRQAYDDALNLGYRKESESFEDYVIRAKADDAFGTSGQDAIPGTTEYRGDEPDTPDTPAKPETSIYNAGFYEAYNAKLAAKQENKIARQKERRDNKSIRRYEKGSKGFLGIGAGKGEGELNERVISAYESRGKTNKNLNYDADGNITGEKGEGGQVVTKQMRDRANTLSMNKTGQEIGTKRFFGDGKKGTPGTTGAQNVTGSVADMNLMNKNKSAMKYNQDQGDSPLSKLRKSKRGPGY